MKSQDDVDTGRLILISETCIDAPSVLVDLRSMHVYTDKYVLSAWEDTVGEAAAEHMLKYVTGLDDDDDNEPDLCL